MILKLGDVDQDNQITLTDLAKAQKIYLNLEANTEYTKIVLDINEDKSLTISDLAKLQKVYLNI